jgi:parallel beta-helix repeat protein
MIFGRDRHPDRNDRVAPPVAIPKRNPVGPSYHPEEWWSFKPGVSLVSEYGPEVTFIELCGMTIAVFFKYEGVRFSGFTVRYSTDPDCEYPPRPPTEGIHVLNCTDAIVENCIIENVSYGIYVEGTSGAWWKPVFRNNVIRDCSFGITVRSVVDPGRPFIEGNVITDCVCGVEAMDSSPMLADNIVMGCRDAGLYYSGRCGGNCKRNVIANNMSHGVLIASADPPLAVPDFNGGLVPADANDFYGNGGYDIDYCYSDRGGVMAKWNWWGADCPDFSGKFNGLVYYSPWTDSTHTRRLDEDSCTVSAEPSTWSKIKTMFR